MDIFDEQLMFSAMEQEGPEVIPIFSDEDDEGFNKLELPSTLPILPLRNAVLFPGVVIPLTVGRKKSMKLIRDIYNETKLIGTVSQTDTTIEDPQAKDLHRVGTVAHIIKILEMPDETTTVIIQGRKRYKINQFVKEDPYFLAEIEPLPDLINEGNAKEFGALIEMIKEIALRIVKMSYQLPPEAAFAIKNIENPAFLVNFISANSSIKVEDKQRLLEIDDLQERANKLLIYLNQELQLAELKNDIQGKVKHDLDKQQREYLLQQQIKTIQNELGQNNPAEQEVKELQDKAKNKKWSKEVAAFFEKEVKKLQRLNPSAGEYSVQVNYLQLLLELPWGVFTKDNFNIKNATKVLDEDHFGLEKVKERILEYLAVLKLKGDLKSPIICLVGPPGVGKTSLGKSVARALKRKYIRISLGGLHDEAEIRGHRKTYIGALPGRIIQSIKKAKSSNPVFILDEIDKLGRDAHGDPSSAMLEVLDPEQNHAFYDNYLEIEYDLSKVMFIATANTLQTIHPALKDRMEVIDVSGYILEEKIEIAKRHLIPKQLKEHGVKASQLKLEDAVITKIIESYTRESGVRELDKKVAALVRQIAKRIASEEAYNVQISQDDIEQYLGLPSHISDIYQGNEYAGVVTGLAWTPAGGEILFVETSLSKGDGKLTITGNLGDVMKESAVIALQFIKSHASHFGIPAEVFDKWNVHVHVPEGAIPKDGPSAGITMITSMVSAFTRNKVKKEVAMTGEITLRGKVLPVGGIKEKILAAKRAGIKEIILSKANEKDIMEIKEIYRKELTFVYVDDIREVVSHTLTSEKVTHEELLY